jgi:hypothetical protein
MTAEVLADDRLCGHRFQAQTFRGECRKPLAMPLHGQVVDGDVLPVRIAKIAPASIPRRIYPNSPA